MRIKLSKLQDDDKETKKLKLKRLLEDCKDIDKIFYYQGFLYMPKVICFKLISRYYNDFLVGYFGIKKIQELIAKNYNWPMV